MFLVCLAIKNRMLRVGILTLGRHSVLFRVGGVSDVFIGINLVMFDSYCAGMVISGRFSFSPVSTSVKSIITKAKARLLFRSRSSIQNQWSL